MKNFALAALLLLAVAFAAYFGFLYYEARNAGELVAHQAVSDQAEISHRLADAEKQAEAALASSMEETRQARQEATSAQQRLAETRTALAAAEAAARTATDEAGQAAAETTRAIAEEKKISTDAIQLSRHQAQEEVAAAASRLDTVLQLLDQEKQRAAAAEKAASDNGLLAAQRQIQLDAARKALAAALAKQPPAKP